MCQYIQNITITRNLSKMLRNYTQNYNRREVRSVVQSCYIHALTITNQNKMNTLSHKTSVQRRVLSLSLLDAAAVSSSPSQHDIF
jgi:hypothetical protein